MRPAHHAPRRAELRASALGTKWRVRPLAQEELLQAAEIQFEGFHRRQNFPPLDALARMTFRWACILCIGKATCSWLCSPLNSV